MTTEDDSLPVPAAAHLVGVSESTIRRWISDGLISAERVGPRLLRVHRSSLENVRHPVVAA